MIPITTPVTVPFAGTAAETIVGVNVGAIIVAVGEGVSVAAGSAANDGRTVEVSVTDRVPILISNLSPG